MLKVSSTEIAPGLQLCHAGRVNGRKTIEIEPLGRLHILYGSRRSGSREALARRDSIISEASDPLANALKDALSEKREAAISQEEQDLMNAIATTLENLFRVTVGFHWVSINLAHELSNMWIGTGLALNELEVEIGELIHQGEGGEALANLRKEIVPVFTESQLGLYICRNFLSHVSESRYREAVRRKFEDPGVQQHREAPSCICRAALHPERA